MNLYKILLLCIMVILLVSCDIQLEGIVIEVNADNVLVVNHVSDDEYEAIQSQSFDELFEQGIDLTYYSYGNTEELAVGDHVKIWTNGTEMTSYPGKASAKKIKIIND